MENKDKIHIDNMNNVANNEHKNRNKNSKEKNKMGHYIMLTLVFFLLIFSVVQSFQIGAVKTKAFSGASVSLPSTQTASNNVPVATKPSAPTMVGGC